MEIKNNFLKQTGAYTTSLNEAQSTARRAGQATQEATSQARGDRVSVSPEALLRTEASKSITAAPDVRQEKVANIKERVANGTYSVDSRLVAKKLIESDAFLAGTIKD